MSHTDEPLSTRDLAPTQAPAGAESARPEERLRDDDAGGARVPEDRFGDEGATIPEERLGDEGARVPEIHEQPVGGSQTGLGGEPASAGSDDADHTPLLPPDQAADLQRRWEQLQTTFVDDPRNAVNDADGLVAGVMRQLAEEFAREREQLEGQWGRGEDVSTEDLRLVLQRYRSFFHRLLSA